MKFIGLFLLPFLVLDSVADEEVAVAAAVATTGTDAIVGTPCADAAEGATGTCSWPPAFCTFFVPALTSCL